MKVAFVGNQGRELVLDFYVEMAREVRALQADASLVFMPWLSAEKDHLVHTGLPATDIYTFEDWVSQGPRSYDEVTRLREEYDVNWSAVIASERAFTDYSLLLGSAGHRDEPREYVLRLLVNIVTFLEHCFKTRAIDAVVCQTADTLFSHVVFKVAKHLGVRVFAITPAWLLESGAQGGYFSNNVFMESETMLHAYAAVKGHELSLAETARVNSFVDSVKGFKNKTPFVEKNRERNAGFTALSPNFSRFISYLRANSNRDPEVEYIKIDPALKFKANVLRLWRKFFNRHFFGPRDCHSIPARSVFFAFQYQPEQSTLSQGLWYANQIALVENISKSLPLGYTLVVKEHPWGRGARPTWQYRHLSGLYNVRFCDAPSKDIITRVDAVIGISGTVGFEALVLDKPTIILGRSFFTHCDLFYQVSCVQDLPGVLRRILVDGEYGKIPDRPVRLNRFLLSYLNALIPYFPTLENASHYGAALVTELAEKKSPVGKKL